MKYYPLQEDFSGLLVKSPRRRLKRSTKGLNSKGFRPFEEPRDDEVPKAPVLPKIPLPFEQPLKPPFVLPPEEEWPIYLDLRSDLGWKKVLGSEGAEQSAVYFITAFLPVPITITNIIYRNVEQQPEFVNGKTNIYDIYCSDQDGNRYILEMQRNDQDYFLNRVVFYACRSIVNQVYAGAKEYVYKSAVIFTFVDFSVLETPTDYYHNIASLRWESGGRELENTIKLHVIELKKFDKHLDELKTLKDKWMYLMKHMGEMTEIPAVFDDEIFRPVFERALFKKLKTEQKMKYFEGILHARDLENQFTRRERIGEARGKAEGIEIGKAEGIEEGIEIGKVRRERGSYS